VVPAKLLEALGDRRLLPVQAAAFELIRNGGDAVIHAPTGSGKTLAFALPLTARLLPGAAIYAGEAASPPAPEAGGNAISMPKAVRAKRRAPPGKPVLPRAVCVVPSRELAKQVGKAWAEFYPGKVAAVFGGAPVERHAYLIRAEGGADVVVGTAGRLRELVREGHLGFGNLATLVRLYCWYLWF
jgi:superfamily II DNA/RNA helicase